MKKILIFGAASAIAQETAKLFAREGAKLYFADLTTERLEAVRDHVNIFHQTEIHIEAVDALDFDSHKKLFENVQEAMGGLDAVLIAHGTLPDQEGIRKDPDAMLREFSINCTSVLSLATIAADIFEKQDRGTLAVISSVAGDRGRQSNYVYGSAKGAVSLFLQGMRNRLSKTNVKIVTIKPGMVDTPMTAHMPKGPLFSKPETVGKGIYEAMIKGRDIVYLPAFWRLVMFIIKMIPEGIFKKLSL